MDGTAKASQATDIDNSSTVRGNFPGLTSRTARLLVLAVCVAAMALAALAAAHRVPWDDEGEFSDAAWNLAKHGFMGSPVLDSPGFHLPHIAQRTYWVMPLYLIGQAAWYLIAPGTIFWTRFFGILWVPIALFSLFRLLGRLTGDRVLAAAACVFFGLSYTLIDNAGFARPDLMCCALGLAGLALYVSFRERSLNTALLLSNAAIAASMFTHPNGIFHFLGLATVVLWLDGRKLNAKALLAAALPYLVAAGLWSLYIAQDPQAFRDQMTANGTNGRWTSTWNPLLILRNEIVNRYLVVFGVAAGGASLAKSYALLMYILAILGVLAIRPLRTQPAVRLVLLLLVVYFGAMSIFNQKLSYYFVHILPWYAALVAICGTWLWQRQRRLRPLLAMAAALLVLVDCAGIVMRARQKSSVAAQTAVADFIRANTKSSDRIAGTAGLLYVLNFDDRLREDKYLGVRGGEQPDVVIVDPDIWGPRYRELERESPEEWEKLHTILASYRLSFDQGGYQIYLRR
jgi:hypothetical protein